METRFKIQSDFVIMDDSVVFHGVPFTGNTGNLPANIVIGGTILPYINLAGNLITIEFGNDDEELFICRDKQAATEIKHHVQDTMRNLKRQVFEQDPNVLAMHFITIEDGFIIVIKSQECCSITFSMSLTQTVIKLPKEFPCAKISEMSTFANDVELGNNSVINIDALQIDCTHPNIAVFRDHNTKIFMNRNHIPQVIKSLIFVINN